MIDLSVLGFRLHDKIYPTPAHDHIFLLLMKLSTLGNFRSRPQSNDD